MYRIASYLICIVLVDVEMNNAYSPLMLGTNLHLFTRGANSPSRRKQPGNRSPRRNRSRSPKTHNTSYNSNVNNTSYQEEARMQRLLNKQEYVRAEDVKKANTEQLRMSKTKAAVDKMAGGSTLSAVLVIIDIC